MDSEAAVEGSWVSSLALIGTQILFVCTVFICPALVSYITVSLESVSPGVLYTCAVCIT